MINDRDILSIGNAFVDYLNDTMYMGRTVGRVCNRIRHGRFNFENREIQLPVNSPPHHLHGGPQGIALREWKVVRQVSTSVTFRITSSEADDGYPGDAKIDREWKVVRQVSTSVTFRITSSEADDGYPGDAKIDVTYTVNDLNQLLIEHGANCATSGVLNLTNHSYWNLDGSPSVKDHLLKVEADSYLPIDEDSFPTAYITVKDYAKLSKMKCVGQAMCMSLEQLNSIGGNYSKEDNAIAFNSIVKKDSLPTLSKICEARGPTLYR
ncbi:aldose 1-epimerase [Dictyocaulus viviparus]|uniref:Galactose mutarotase n=1 Tax=Dictyocaulus viviparus TaxID=29172 RepID=A0A0D8Y1X0_DICVI|nr:aldose 1-epimerase [Dictyocaulus viviparus]